jgi:hypothetical protein
MLKKDEKRMKKKGLPINASLKKRLQLFASIKF